MQVERLRLSGFKSFVDPTELAIKPGLTGIVGPNGCGKSNLVEALRWVMGEASARRLRGGEMDDVIFAGSASRPARNIAEVSLTIDNAGREAPFAFNDRDAIEIVRRIDRGSGSAYRVNGREARARDVQLLFADAATGAHSGGLVSQGRIGALIAAKPSERRALLDEAAGTAGLHARRHEAELKLKGAEENLLRLDDVIATMAMQLEGLKRQARQAQRYRRLSEQIRRTEARLLEARWRNALAEAERITGELREAERAVAAATEAAVTAERLRAAADEALPPLRLSEAAASAALHRITHAREALEEELARLAAARQEAAQRQGHLAGDVAREDEHVADADAAIARLAAERRGLERDAADAAARAAASAQLEKAAAELAAAEIGLQQMTEAAVTGEARRAGLERRRAELAERQARLRQRLGENAAQRHTLGQAAVPQPAIAEATAKVATAGEQADAARAAAAAAAERLTAARAAETGAVDAAREAERRLARLKAEADALASILAPAPKAGAAGGKPAMLSLLTVPPGYEAATASLFDDDLAAPLIGKPGEAPSGQTAGWIELPALDKPAALPEGARPLADEITAPAALARRLGQAGIVASEEDGWRLQTRLVAGQSLVDREGRLWRWDGFARLELGDGGAAEQLRQRNRLAALTGNLTDAETASRTAEATGAAARSQSQQAASSEREAATALRQAEEALARCRAEEAALSRRALDAEARLAALTDAADKLAAEIAETETQAAETARALALVPDPALARAGLDGARAQAGAARRHESEAHATVARLTQEAEARQRRLDLIAGETGSWQQRRERALAQRQVLNERQTALAAEIAALEARPAAIAGEIAALTQKSTQAAAGHRAASDALALGETRLRTANDTAREAEHALSAAREERARAEVRRDGAAANLIRLREEIRERLETLPEALAELAEDGEAIPAPAELDARLDRLARERGAIGPVNLVAEREAEEVGERVESLQNERNELTEAIVRLRRGIAALDQEGRKRLQGAFDILNQHFSELFVRLFGGGRAHLALTDAEDPLDAGLDIMASPPGKRLQTLSLLSGGEQALTAIALIFAVFLTNPAPICVLDEVDAPLDDANVERFCRLIAETADTTGTRFLLITHHRITMAHMDRLFGVTMAEQGVSQLVSVDLARAAELHQTAYRAGGNIAAE